MTLSAVGDPAEPMSVVVPSIMFPSTGLSVVVPRSNDPLLVILIASVSPVATLFTKNARSDAGVVVEVLVRIDAIRPVDVAPPEASCREKRSPAPMPEADAVEVAAVPWPIERTSTIDEELESPVNAERVGILESDDVVELVKLPIP